MSNKLDCQQIGLEYGVKLDSKNQTNKQYCRGIWPRCIHQVTHMLQSMYLRCFHFVLLVAVIFSVFLTLCMLCSCLPASVICILKMVPNHNSVIDMMHLSKLHIYRVSQEECARLREGVPYVKLYRYNPKHLCPKWNGYRDNGQRNLKLWQLLHTYWLPNTY